MEVFVWIWKLKFKIINDTKWQRHTKPHYHTNFSPFAMQSAFSNGKMCLHMIHIKKNELLIDKQSSVVITRCHEAAHANTPKSFPNQKILVLATDRLVFVLAKRSNPLQLRHN